MILGLEPFHVCVVTGNLDADVTSSRRGLLPSLEEPLGATLRVLDHKTGRESDLPVRSAWARTGSVLLEVTQACAGSVWETPGLHHVGVWAPDIEGITARALELGASVEVTGWVPGTDDPVFRYLQVPTGPLRVELVSDAMRPYMDAVGTTVTGRA